MTLPAPRDDTFGLESQVGRYSKRKAPDPRDSPAPGESSVRYCHDPYETPKTAYPSDSSQKRQRTTLMECDMLECWGEFDKQTESFAHKQFHEVTHSAKTQSSGSSYSESMTSTIMEHISDSEYSCGSGLTNDSSSSNHSSPRPIDFEYQGNMLYGSLDGPSEVHIMQSPNAYELADGELLNALSIPSIYDPSIPRSMIYSAPDRNVSVPQSTLDQNYEKGQLTTRKFQSPPEGPELEQETVAVSEVSHNRSSLVAPSTAGTEQPSSEGGGSSESHPSSEASDSTPHKIRELGDNNPLRSIIDQALRPDTEVSELLFHLLKDRLECAAPSPDDHFKESGLSLFSLLELQDTKPIENSRAFTTYAPSSSSGSSSFSNSGGRFGGSGGNPSSSSNAKNTSGDNTNRGGTYNSADDNNFGQLTEQQRNVSRPSTSQASMVAPFRCIFNALYPNIFRVTPETKRKYATCSGPGWNTIQHLKEHNKSHHTKESNPLQCIRCQEKFKSQKILRDHLADVDCAVKCPICGQEFDRKDLRKEHQEQEHSDLDIQLKVDEIDEALQEKISQNLKALGDSIKNKKGKGLVDPQLEKWIEDNTERYMTGRPAKANARLELGQWYTMFKTISSRHIPDHPFYDHDTLLLPSDLAAEKILLIHENLITARIQQNIHPPAGGQEQRDWYQDVLRDSLRIAAKTKLILRDQSTKSSTVEVSPMSLYSQDMGPNTAPATSYNSPDMTSAGDMLYASGSAVHQSMAQSYSAQQPGLSNKLPDMPLPPVFPENQHEAATLPAYYNVGFNTLSDSSANIGDLPDWGPQYLPNDDTLCFEPQQQINPQQQLKTQQQLNSQQQLHIQQQLNNYQSAGPHTLQQNPYHGYQS